MVCPYCDGYLQKDERLIIGPSDKDGYFRVNHYRFGVAVLDIVPICEGGYFNRASFK